MFGKQATTIALAAALMMPLVLSIATTPATAGGPGRILVLEGYQNAVSPALTAVGFPPCGSQAHGCHVVVSPAAFGAFTPLDYQVYSIVVAGLWVSHATQVALNSQAANLDQFVTNEGGTLVTFASGGFGWVPGGGVVAASKNADDVVVTTHGSTHPAFGGLGSSSLSNWGQSYHYQFSSWPSYLQPLATDSLGNEIVLAGHRGNGCALVSAIDADWHSAHDWTPSDRANARQYLHAAIDFAFTCDCGHGKPCEPAIRLGGVRWDGIYDRRGGVEGDLDGDGTRDEEGIPFPERIGPFGNFDVDGDGEPDSLNRTVMWAHRRGLDEATYTTFGSSKHPTYKGPATVNLQACHCLVTRVVFDYTVYQDDGIPDFAFPTHTQTANKPEWTVVPPPDGDVYLVKVTVVMDCFEEGPKTLTKEFLLRS